MKKFLKVVAVLLVIIAVGIGTVFFLTRGLAEQADLFLRAAATGDVDSAFVITSSDFRATTSKGDLARFFKENHLDEYLSSSWSSRQIEAGSGQISGTVKTAKGSSRYTLSFIKEEGEWKLLSIRKPTAGLIQGDAQAAQMPSEAEQVALVAESMSQFADAVEHKSMVGFRNYISNLWRNQYTVEALDEAYAPFYRIAPNLHSLDRVPPQFDKPTFIDKNGVLEIEGHYPGQQARVNFGFSYIFEGTKWKMLGLQISVE